MGALAPAPIGSGWCGCGAPVCIKSGRGWHNQSPGSCEGLAHNCMWASTCLYAFSVSLQCAHDEALRKLAWL